MHHSGENDPSKAERAPLDFEVELQNILERYPELAEKIQSSLKTPQLGAYHNEGRTMESHLRLIVKTLDDVGSGKMHEIVEARSELVEKMCALVLTSDENGPEQSRINPELIDYAFLHDISKQDCLTLKVEGEKLGREVTWGEWQEIARQGEPYAVNGKPIVSVSYYHQSEGEEGQHGNKGAALLKAVDIPPYIRTAISKHEVAYQFSKTNAATYEKNFVKSGLGENEQLFVLIASYVDTMSSLTKDGTPDLKNYRHLLQSRDNYLLIQSYLDRGATFRENDLGFLKKQDKVLLPEDIERFIQNPY